MSAICVVGSPSRCRLLRALPRVVPAVVQGYLDGRTYDRPEEDTRVNRGPLMVFKHNLFDHIGTVSSFEVRPDRPKW